MPGLTAPNMRRSERFSMPARLVGLVGYGKKTGVYKIADKVMQRARRIYSGMDLYVFRYEFKEDGSWELRNSKPCAHCVEIIKTIGIRYVYYSEIECLSDGTQIPRITKIRARDLVNDHMSFGRRMVLKKTGK